VAFLAVFFAWPLAVTAHRAVTAPGLAGQGSTIAASAIVHAAVTTVALAAAGTALTLLIGLPATWALHRRVWLGARAIEAVLSAPFVLPTVVVALAFLTLQRDAAPWLGAAHGIPAIVLALAFFNIAVVLRTVGPAFDAIDERLIAAARTLGARPYQSTARVIWPSIRRAVGASAAITFLFCSTSFALVLILGGTRVQTLEATAYLELTTFLDLRGAALIALVQAALIGTLVAVVGRLARDRGASAIPAATVRATATRRELVGALGAVAPALALVFAPLVTLVARSLGGLEAPTLRHFGALWAGSGAAAPLGPSLVTSITLAFVATFVACGLGTLAVAAGALDTRLRWIRGATAGPLAVSSVVVGVGLLIALAAPMRSWSGGTYVLLTAAQGLIALPLVVHVLGPAVDAIDKRQLAAATTLGAAPLAVLTRVIAPLLRSAFASAAGLAFAVAIGEFGASVFLVRPGTPTLPTTIARLLSRPGADNVDTAAAGAVVLSVITGAVMMAANMRRRELRT
jgi:thiamine transport system permease protein